MVLRKFVLVCPPQALECGARTYDPILVIMPVFFEPSPLLHRVEENRRDVDIVVV